MTRENGELPIFESDGTENSNSVEQILNIAEIKYRKVYREYDPYEPYNPPIILNGSLSLYGFDSIWAYFIRPHIDRAGMDIDNFMKKLEGKNGKV